MNQFEEYKKKYGHLSSDEKEMRRKFYTYLDEQNMMLEAVGQVNAEASATSVAVAVGAAGGAGAVIPGPEPDNGVYIPTIMTFLTTTTSETVILPLVPDGLYNGVIDWGDGATASNNYDNRSHVYATAGTKTVTIDGRIIGFTFEPGYGPSGLKVRTFTQWGTVRFQWPDPRTGQYIGDSFFQSCEDLNLTAVTDVPTMINTFNWSEGFLSNRNANSSVNRLNEWDMSKITSLYAVFFRNFVYNQNIGNWNTGNVVSMQFLFYRANQFNHGGSPSINNWNTSKVVNMAGTFYQTAFNQPIGSWDVSKVEDMGQMLQQTPFNQDISAWNVGRVKSMGAMFYYSTAFNQNIGSWNVASVTNMAYMFEGATAFDQNIGNWSIGTVSNFTNFMSTKTNLTFSSANLDAIYNGWSGQNVRPNITISFGTAQYTAAGAAGRALLVSKGWTITDGGQTP
jgi:surface protein